MRLIDPKYIKIIALAISLPSSIFALGWFLLKLAQDGVIHKLLAVGLIILYVANTIFLIAYYASKNKD